MPVLFYMKIISSNLNNNEYTVEIESMEEAMTIIEHLQSTISNKDRRILSGISLINALRQENELLYDRIDDLKTLLQKFGVKVV
jgi:hypothetical protein